MPGRKGRLVCAPPELRERPRPFRTKPPVVTKTLS